LERQGWLFFPVRPEVRESTCRLIRLWLDAVLLHLATIPPKALANGRQRSLSTTAPGRSTDTRPPRLFFVDESSLASTRQVNDFLKRLRARDRVIFVGDARQHQGVEAGRPFEQLQQAGMQTARLDQIVRQRDPGLKQAVEQLARGEVREGIENLARQGRVHEIADPKKRMSAIAADYAAQPGNTLVVSPDNASRIERSTGSFTKRYRRERRSRRQNIARPYSRPARS
jgi:hypothetical protein